MRIFGDLVQVFGVKETYAEVEDMHDGKYRATLVPSIVGQQSVHVLLSGQHVLGSPCAVDVLSAKEFERMGTSPRPTAAAAKRAPASAPPSAATGGKHAPSSRGGTIVADSFEAWSADGGVPHAAASGPRRAASGAASVGTAPGKRAQVGSKAQAPKAAASAHEGETQPQSMPMTVSQWGTAEARPFLPPS